MIRFEDRERWSDRELVAGVAADDRAAFAALYRRHMPRIVAYLLRETRDPEAAADLTAEVFARAWLSRASRVCSIPAEVEALSSLAPVCDHQTKCQQPGGVL